MDDAHFFQQDYKQNDQNNYQSENDGKVYRGLSCFHMIGTCVHCIIKLKLIFLPLHVEKLLIVRVVVGKCQSGM